MSLCPQAPQPIAPGSVPVTVSSSVPGGCVPGLMSRCVCPQVPQHVSQAPCPSPPLPAVSLLWRPRPGSCRDGAVGPYQRLPLCLSFPVYRAPMVGSSPLQPPTLGTPPHTPSSRGKEMSQQEEGHGKQQHPCPCPLPARPSAQACHEKHLLYCPRYSAARPFLGVLGGSPSPLACVFPPHPPTHHDGTPPKWTL